MLSLIKKIVGTKNDREIKRIRPHVERINALEPDYQKLTDAELKGLTEQFKNRISEAVASLKKELDEIQSETVNADPERREELKSRAEELDKELREKESETLEEILPEAFTAVREASQRTIGLRHFDVQLIGGVVLHEGKIAEMKTGEGKTLVATLPLYLKALTGRGVHIVTVNDYLAKRDSEWMGRLYRFLGLTVGVIVHDLDDEERRNAYAADVTYGTNNEFGFDYLRDNMKFDIKDCVQRGHHYAIVDEVDSILIDEARTPLIISGP